MQTSKLICFIHCFHIFVIQETYINCKLKYLLKLDQVATTTLQKF
jgi:hypothetical protein